METVQELPSNVITQKRIRSGIVTYLDDSLFNGIKDGNLFLKKNIKKNAFF
ncbi:MAG: hypothetical protein R6X27_06770 [Candidatus Desulfacyla sp.]